MKNEIFVHSLSTTVQYIAFGFANKAKDGEVKKEWGFRLLSLLAYPCTSLIFVFMNVALS